MPRTFIIVSFFVNLKGFEDPTNLRDKEDIFEELHVNNETFANVI